MGAVVLDAQTASFQEETSHTCTHVSASPSLDWIFVDCVRSLGLFFCQAKSFPRVPAATNPQPQNRSVMVRSTTAPATAATAATATAHDDRTGCAWGSSGCGSGGGGGSAPPPSRTDEKTAQQQIISRTTTAIVDTDLDGSAKVTPPLPPVAAKVSAAAEAAYRLTAPEKLAVETATRNATIRSIIDAAASEIESAKQEAAPTQQPLKLSARGLPTDARSITEAVLLSFVFEQTAIELHQVKTALEHQLKQAAAALKAAKANAAAAATAAAKKATDEYAALNARLLTTTNANASLHAAVRENVGKLQAATRKDAESAAALVQSRITICELTASFKRADGLCQEFDRTISGLVEERRVSTAERQAQIDLRHSQVATARSLAAREMDQFNNPGMIHFAQFRGCCCCCCV